MINGKKLIVVMPAYNAAATLQQTYDEVMAHGLVDEIIVVDDASRDETARLAASLPGVHLHVHPRNRGYGANQKTCYRLALERGADITLMVHPDYQYSPLLLPAMTSPIANGVYDSMLGSRILGGGALKGGMPGWKYVANRALTKELLEAVPWERNPDDFVFDNQMLAQIWYFGFSIGEVSCPTRYFPEASSINFRRSVKYGFGCLATGADFRLAKSGFARKARFRPKK